MNWNSSKDHIRIMLKDVEVHAHVGLHPWEKHPERPTRLIINIDMYAHLKSKAHSADTIVDYDLIRNALKKWPSRPHTPLLETLAEELMTLAFENQSVEACRISIVKPDIFAEAAGAGVEIYRTRDK
jgi:dihydroneopterin aldolase